MLSCMWYPESHKHGGVAKFHCIDFQDSDTHCGKLLSLKEIFISVHFIHHCQRGSAIILLLPGVSWTREHLTVESSVNLRDWSIRYYSRSRIFTANERNSQNKSLKENVEKRRTLSIYFRSSEWNKWSRVLPVLCDPRAFRKRPSTRILLACSRRNSSRTQMRWDFARRLFWARIRKRPHEPSLPKDDGLDELNKAIVLALSDEFFSSVPSGRQIAARICVPKSIVYRRLVDFLPFTVKCSWIHRRPQNTLGNYAELVNLKG
jgi:hypothetical protein